MTANPAEDVQDLELGDEPYESAEDEDFQLDDVHSESASEGEEPGPAKKRKAEAREEGSGDVDSGDEETIQKARRKRKGKKTKTKGGADEDEDVDFDDDEGGPGGFVRTRAMKTRMKEERKPLAKIDGATVDVDSLWKKMNSADTDSGLLLSNDTNTEPTPDESANKDAEAENRDLSEQQKQTQFPDEFVKIKRTYKFAGEMITEEKVAPKDSAEAKVFMASEGNADTLTAADVEDSTNAKAVKLRRPLRKLSRFDPNPTGSIQKSWEKQPLPGTAPEAENAKGPRINTVEKSKLDWAAYVDQAGIKDELKVHSKAKEGYLGRMDFLDRVGAKQEEERRNVRLRGL